MNTRMVKRSGGRTLSTAIHALQALELIAQSPKGVPVKTVARVLGLSLSSTYSLMNSLRAENFIEQSPAGPGLYVLGSRLLDLYRSYVQMSLQPERLEPFLEELRDRTAARAYAAIWKEGDLEVAEIRGRRGTRELQDISKGFRGAAHALALGKIFLAELPEPAWPTYLHVPVFKRFTRYTMTSRADLRHNLAAVRQRGLGLDMEEYNLGVSCIAAPVRDHDGHLISTLAISVPARRLKYQYRALATALRHTAGRASEEVGKALDVGGMAVDDGRGFPPSGPPGRPVTARRPSSAST